MTCVAAVADEIAFWQADDGSANPDTEILRAIRPSLLTTGGPLIAISSALRPEGRALDHLQARDYGTQGDPRILVARAASREGVNPTLRQADIDRAKWPGTRRPALAEYWRRGFRTDISAFVSQEVIDGCVAHGRSSSCRRLLRVFRISGFVDPSGGASDAMTLGDRPSSGRHSHSRRGAGNSAAFQS